jgi:hypothetical protein
MFPPGRISYLTGAIMVAESPPVKGAAAAAIG